jgi:hypothetical protein
MTILLSHPARSLAIRIDRFCDLEAWLTTLSDLLFPDSCSKSLFTIFRRLCWESSSWIYADGSQSG